MREAGAQLCDWNLQLSGFQVSGSGVKIIPTDVSLSSGQTHDTDWQGVFLKRLLFLIIIPFFGCRDLAYILWNESDIDIVLLCSGCIDLVTPAVQLNPVLTDTSVCLVVEGSNPLFILLIFSCHHRTFYRPATERWQYFDLLFVSLWALCCSADLVIKLHLQCLYFLSLESLFIVWL